MQPPGNLCTVSNTWRVTWKLQNKNPIRVDFILDVLLFPDSLELAAMSGTTSCKGDYVAQGSYSKVKGRSKGDISDESRYN